MASDKAAQQRTKLNEESAAAKSLPLPLFFSAPAIITKDRHASAKVHGDITMAFARETNSIPVVMADIPEAAKQYPIAFTKNGRIMPVAIVGLEQRNYFVKEDGQWEEGYYVPSYVRKYPFVFMEDQENDKLTLCVDEAALTFNTDAEGHALYADGQPSTFINKALEFCAAYQEECRVMAGFCKALEDKGLLMPQRSDIDLASGRAIQLGGFQLIDPEKFKMLPEADILEWHKCGLLQMIYYILQSTSNWGRLLDLGNKNETSALTK